jgi:hypothetical protein
MLSLFLLTIIVVVFVAAKAQQYQSPQTAGFPTNIIYALNQTKALEAKNNYAKNLELYNKLTITTNTKIVYPLFKQCESIWGSDYMGSKTICSVGCLMSSTAMGLAGWKVPIPQATPSDTTPQNLNAWLKGNQGYADNSLIESVVPSIDLKRITWGEDAFHSTNDLSFATVCSYIELGRVVIANVHNGGHFVLITGCMSDKDTFSVNDPGFDTLSYSYKNDVVGYRIYDITAEAPLIGSMTACLANGEDCANLGNSACCSGACIYTMDNWGWDVYTCEYYVLK